MCYIYIYIYREREIERETRTVAGPLAPRLPRLAGGRAHPSIVHMYNSKKY